MGYALPARGLNFQETVFPALFREIDPRRDQFDKGYTAVNDNVF
jgi:hypothetical protein